MIPGLKPEGEKFFEQEIINQLSVENWLMNERLRLIAQALGHRQKKKN